ncbi:MAG: DUF1566 domain-containing protein, partial [Alphaproteobacteria bacterium]
SAQTAADQAKRDGYHVKCDDALVKGYGAAELRYGASCPSAGDVGAVKTYLTRCATDVGDATGPVPVVPVPDYVAELAACNGNIATVQAGTATAADVAKGKTFSSGSGLGLTGTAWPNGLLKTGQTTSYGAGSDGNLQKGAAQSFTDNGDGTVTDNRTGLMWEKKSDDGSIHDQDNVYTWWSGAPTIIGPAMNGTMVSQFLATLNTAPCFAGYCDWRIPNRNELLSIINLETYLPATFAAFNTSCTVGCTVTACSCTRNGHYWSSSTYQYYPNYAWGVYFSSGYDFDYDKTLGYYVRAVRGGS